MGYYYYFHFCKLRLANVTVNYRRPLLNTLMFNVWYIHTFMNHFSIRLCQRYRISIISDSLARHVYILDISTTKLASAIPFSNLNWVNKHQFITKKLHTLTSEVTYFRRTWWRIFYRGLKIFPKKVVLRWFFSCDGMSIDIQYYPSEIFAVKKPWFSLFWNSFETQLMINCPKLAEVISPLL